uniref:FHA domain-containing protein n=1 Tax=Parastrongyloides trichosuri TaxID=131310 RepID=A0A0N4Z738_PARTI
MSNENPFPEYPIPSWHGEPPEGIHLDVIKDDSLVQKIMVDEKEYYYFGRNPQQVDITLEHASCSRVHAILIYHKALKRFALVDLKSSHGTFCGKMKLQPFTPMFLNIGDVFHFGASTRKFAVREKPKETIIPIPDETDEVAVTAAEDQLACLTEYNTTLNRKKQIIECTDEECRRKKKPRGKVKFYEEEIILNLDEFDDKIGKFRNMAVSFVISDKKSKNPSYGKEENVNDKINKYAVKRKLGTGESSSIYGKRNKLSFKNEALGNMFLNAAPDFDNDNQVFGPALDDVIIPKEKKKIYAKEAWPGKKLEDESGLC